MAAPTIIASILTGGTNSHQTTSEEVNGVATDFVSEGVVGTFTNTSGVAPMTGGFAVNASGTPDANINISTGVAYVTATPTSQNSQSLRIKCTVTGTLAISSNSSGSTKYDWIYISVSASAAANPNSGADDVATIVASRSSSASTDDGTPPTYGYPIAVVTVANGFTTITNGNIRDLRANSIVNLGSSSVSSGWVDLGYAPNTVTNNGNRSYDLVFNSTDLTSTLSAGMRLKLTRLVSAPTQCTDLEASSSQYFSRASAGLTGMTFTDDFTLMAWIKLESYQADQQVIVGRQSTTGFHMDIDTTGQLRILGFGTAGALDMGVSYQSIPLGKWVHVAASLDMSGTSALLYIDGVLVPSAYTNGAASAIVQAGDLVIGNRTGQTEYFDGKIAQVAIFSSVLSAATIRSYMSQGLSGSETNLVSAYSFNNSIVDLNATNANDLSAQGSAVATNADSPFGIQADGTTAGTTEYGIITKTAFSTNTTLTVQVPEGNAIPTSGGVSAVSYSTQKVPYGMPVDKGKWSVLSLFQVQVATTSNATYGAYNAGGDKITVPAGAWNFGVDMALFNATTTVVEFALANIDPTGNSAGSTWPRTSSSDFTQVYRCQASAATNHFNWVSSREPINLTSATTFTLYSVGATTGGGIDSDDELHQFIAECAYL